MERLGKLWAIGVLVSLMSCPSHADDFDWEDILAPYIQRTDPMTPSAGDAHNINTATQMITPWPPYVLNRRIRSDGARIVGAVERYRNPMVLGSGGNPLVGAATSPDSGNGSSDGTEGNGQTGAGGQPNQ